MENQGRRRRFIAMVNRNLEGLLRVNVAAEEVEEVALEENEEQFQQLARRTRQINEIRRLVRLVPRAIINRVAHSTAIARIRELIADLRVENLPQDLLDFLNDVL